MDDTLADPLTGRLLDGRYAVTARIAHGGMATVYQATDTRLDREVALKVMHAELARDEEFVRRFIGEAKSVARLSHQNVVAVFDQGADGPFLYLAMEYVPGRTLKELLRDSGRFSPATALEIMTGVLDGLAAAHASGIVHRDIKPENVLLTADGRIKVADFGLARAQSAAGHTRAGLLIGTVAYVPPEQVTGGSTGPGGDVYSAGVMLFELLTGRLPFTGDTPLSVAYQHVNSDIPAPSTLVPGIPAAVDQLVLAATSRDPARRPADAGEFVRAVRRVREGLAESSGLTGVMGAGVQGLAEAPWLDLDTPAATNGWWARTGAMPAASVHDTGPRGAAATSVTEHEMEAFGAAPPPRHPGNGQFGTGQFHGDGREDSHTLVVDREDGDRYQGGRHQRRPGAVPGPLAVQPAAAHRRADHRARRGARARRLVAHLRPVRAGALGVRGQRQPGHRRPDRRRLHRQAGRPGAQQHGGQRHGGRHQPGRAGVEGLDDHHPRLERALHLRGAQGAERHADRRAGRAAARAPGLHHRRRSARTLRSGTVIGTNPPAGTTWPQTKTVTILVAARPAAAQFRRDDHQTPPSSGRVSTT